MAKYMGSDVTSGGLRFQVADKFQAIAQLQRHAHEIGLDPKNVNLGVHKKDLKGNGLGG